MKSKKNKYNAFVEILSFFLLIGVWIYLFLNWGNMPDKIPGHYNAVGEENKKREYQVMKNMLNTMNLFVVAIFVYLTINSSKAILLPMLFLPVFLISIFGSLIFFIENWLE